MLWLIVLLVVAGPLFLLRGPVVFYTRKALGKPQTPALPAGPKLSDVSKRLLKAYDALPNEHKFGDIAPMLHALDIKCGIEGAKYVHHFNWWTSDYHDSHHYQFHWDGAATLQHCRHTNCKFADYVVLKKRIDRVLEEAAEQKRLLAVAEVQGDIDLLKSLSLHLDNESKALVESNRTIKEILK